MNKPIYFFSKTNQWYELSNFYLFGFMDEEGRKMIASVGYTADLTDYNLSLDDTPSAIEVNGEQMTSGQGKTDGTDEVDLVPAGS